MVKLIKITFGATMKSVYLFCSRLWVYLTEIPVMILLWVTLSYNGESDDVFKFYPLIIFLSAAIIFIFVYFFRVISISCDEIRFHGLFSSKDSALISEGKTLALELSKAKTLKIMLFEDAGKEPAFEWMKAEDVIHRDICMFRGRAIGGAGTAKKILRFYGVPEESAKDVTLNGFSYEDENVKISTLNDGELATIKIKFKKTII
jgi:hypothetical protein